MCITTHYIKTAKALAAMKGTELAARYLRKRGFSFNAAHWILIGIKPRRS